MAKKKLTKGPRKPSSGSVIEQIESGSAFSELEEQSHSIDERFEARYNALARELERSPEKRDQAAFQSLSDVTQYIKNYQKTAGELSFSLAKELEAFTENLVQSSDLTFIERVAQSFGEKGKIWARRRHLQRVRTQGFRKTMGTILNLGREMIAAIQDREVKDQKMLATLRVDRDKITDEYRTSREKYEQWKKDRETYQVQKEELEGDLKVAEPAQRADLQKKFDEMERLYTDAKTKEGQFLIVMQRSEQDKPYLQKSIDEFASNVEAIKKMRINLQQEIVHFMNLLPSAQNLIETVLVVEGTGKYKDAFDTLKRKHAELSARTSRAILEEAGRQLEQEPLTPEEFEAFLKEYEAGIAVMDEVMDKIQAGLYEP